MDFNPLKVDRIDIFPMLLLLFLFLMLLQWPYCTLYYRFGMCLYEPTETNTIVAAHSTAHLQWICYMCCLYCHHPTGFFNFLTVSAHRSCPSLNWNHQYVLTSEIFMSRYRVTLSHANTLSPNGHWNTL